MIHSTGHDENHIAVALDTLEMTEEDLDKSKVFKTAEKTAVTIEAERSRELTFDKESCFVEAGIIIVKTLIKWGRDLDF
jgi:hypothetical protein